jgi:hypothetical protein
MSAIQSMNNNAEMSAALQNPHGGARRRRKYRGGQVNTGQSTITLPQGPPNIAKDPNANTSFGVSHQTMGAQVNQIKQNNDATGDSVAYVAPVTTGVPVKTGGRRTKKSGGYHKWGCYSGGKRKSRRHSKKSSRKSRKSRRK